MVAYVNTKLTLLRTVFLFSLQLLAFMLLLLLSAVQCEESWIAYTYSTVIFLQRCLNSQNFPHIYFLRAKLILQRNSFPLFSHRSLLQKITFISTGIRYDRFPGKTIDHVCILKEARERR